MIYALSLITTFIAVGLKGFQQKNVIGGHLKTVVVTSYLMAVFDVLSVYLIVKGGWTIAITAGTGASMGMICAITLHNRVFKS